MLGELTKGSCSMFGAWDSALPAGTGVLQLRALDWNMDGTPSLILLLCKNNCTILNGVVGF